MANLNNKKTQIASMIAFLMISGLVTFMGIKSLPKEQNSNVIKRERQLRIGGMNMGTTYDYVVDVDKAKSNTDSNKAINKAIQDYHNQIISSARSRNR